MSWINIFQEKEGIGIQDTKSRKTFEMRMESQITMGNISLVSKVLFRWEMFLHKATEKGYHFTLINLEHSLLENSSPALEDIFQATRAMMQMFAEVQVITDRKGNIQEILNQPKIKERWARAKKELISFTEGVSMRAEQVYNIPEAEVDDMPLLTKRIQAMEFFEVFFGGPYGYDLPLSFKKKRQNLMHNMSYESVLEAYADHTYQEKSCKKILLKGINLNVSNKELKAAYGEMPFVEIEKVNFKATRNGIYFIHNQTGWLEHASLSVQEQVSPTLHGEILYNITITN